MTAKTITDDMLEVMQKINRIYASGDPVNIARVSTAVSVIDAMNDETREEKKPA